MRNLTPKEIYNKNASNIPPDAEHPILSTSFALFEDLRRYAIHDTCIMNALMQTEQLLSTVANLNIPAPQTKNAPCFFDTVARWYNGHLDASSQEANNLVFREFLIRYAHEKSTN